MKRKIFAMFDYLMILAVLILVILGILFVYSAGINSDGVLINDKYIKQIIWASIGFVFMIAFTIYDYRKVESFTVYFYGGILIVLLITPFFAPDTKGARSWFGIGGLGIQPSEFGKIFYILFLAKFLDSSKNMTPLKRFSIAAIIMFLPMGLILLQPDLGTATVYLPIFLIMCFIAGIPVQFILYITLFGGLTIFFVLLPLWNTFVVTTPITFINIFSNLKLCGILIGALIVLAILGFVIRFLYHGPKYVETISIILTIVACALAASLVLSHILGNYQKLRLITFLNPDIDRIQDKNLQDLFKNAEWNVKNSKIAIGAGRLLGTGFVKGSQSHLAYVPEQDTDFIFSILAEELGFLGGCFVFALYLFLLIKMLYIVKKCQNNFGAYIAAGIFAMFAFHFIVNVGMVMGLMPITGIPLLFLSYGGSSLLTAMCCIGIIMNINYRKSDFV